MKIAVKDLLPNPYRHLERYPIIEAKVDNLVASIDQTTFWDNLLARKSADKPGKFELAYGIHRREALKRARISEIDIPVRNLNDATMIKIMANENMEEWGHSASIEQETIRAVVEGYAKGKFDLPQPGKAYYDAAADQPFLSGRGSGISRDTSRMKPYSVKSLVEFLGWKRYKVETAMAALSMISEKLVDEKSLAGLTARQAKVVTDEISHVVKRTNRPGLAAAVGRKIAAGLKQSSKGRDRSGNQREHVQDVTIHSARTRTEEMIKPHVAKEKPKELPDAAKFIDRLVHQMLDMPTDQLKSKVDNVIAVKADIPAKELRHLISALRGVAKRFERMAEKLEA